MSIRALLPLLLLLLIATPAMAQDLTVITASTQALDQGAKELKAVDTAFSGRTDSAAKQALRDRATAVSQNATTQATQLAPELAQVDARIGQLGAVTPGVVEASDIRGQRKLLGQQRSTIDSTIKRAKLMAVEAGQLSTEIGESQADAFNERMSERVASPITPAFWSPVLHALPRDAQRLGLFLDAEGRVLGGGFTAGRAWPALLGILVALAMMVPLRIVLRRLGRKVMIERAPASRLRRSGLAFWLVVVGTLVPGFAAGALVAGFRSAGMLAPMWEPLAAAFVRAAFVSGLIAALGGALLQRRQPSWRLLPIGDDAAHGLRPWTLMAGGAVMASVLLSSLSDTIGASGPASEAADVLIALVHILLVSGILVAGSRLRMRAMSAMEETDAPASAAGGAFLSLAAWGVSLAAIGALLLGYVSLSLTLSQMLVWLPTVAATLYLLLIVTDDICTGIFSGHSGLGQAMHHGFGVRTSLVDQFGVALSALIRLLLVALAATLIFRPFGSNIGSLLGVIGQVTQGVTIGQITIAPGAILRAGAVLAVGIFVVRLVQHWLTDKYLPATELDAGARNSISMVARYSGLILATLWALASLGIGIERIALLLSALSVGIGFGLQAITQNFVSGLILLAERPVKIGDWVRIGDQEGDVKRISVRATEIQIADRSTLIVPNSELITKTILNKTLTDPIGRVQLQFSVPIGSDVARVREMVSGLFDQAPAVLDEPAPHVFVDSIADGRVNLNCFAYVRSPRDAYPTKSELLFRLLTEMAEAKIELGTTPQQFQFIGGGPMPTPPASPGSEGPIAG